MTRNAIPAFIQDHHRQAIENLAERFKEEPGYLAVIISGSVAKGIAREDSDIDCYLVVSDEEFQQRKQRDDLFFYETEGCDYQGGYYDGKIIDFSFIQAAAERGSEPTRASFEGAFAVFTRIPGLQQLIDRIPVYPEANRERNFADFYAQVDLYGGYFADRAIVLNNSYLLAHAVSQVALFAGRLILAHNRILFPCHKSLAHALRQAPEKPRDYLELQQAMLEGPTRETIGAVVASIQSFRDWGLPGEKTISRFVLNNEWNWLDGEPPLSDR
ncbi:nucleotidyltransferase domain-containing protein [Paenibacillus nasutitermitis]|uniref:Polymerase nucleotidyl transferase domain-containing protein n=1 Tax=Paenibacillus nasutitermitis TaxID=1652958 RepID=A0A916ZIF9_9BACL|nr:nucleotidyltransferase domain-containing protein [Paenibacillus nasutitermitis]GGD98178.1 hypothetical protein GCM10010911_66220 [Paenibacillus nasutitermitis]